MQGYSDHASAVWQAMLCCHALLPHTKQVLNLQSSCQHCLLAIKMPSLTVTASKASYPCCHCRRGEASLLFVVFVMLSVKLSCWLSSSRVLRRPLPLDWARGGRLSLPLRKSATPEPDAPLHTNRTHDDG